eukprot:2223656-Rhodomonas_salina.1
MMRRPVLISCVMSSAVLRRNTAAMEQKEPRREGQEQDQERLRERMGRPRLGEPLSGGEAGRKMMSVSYTHLRAHETEADL